MARISSLLLLSLVNTSLLISILVANSPTEAFRTDRRSAEMRLKNALLKNYDVSSRPVRDDNETIQTTVGLSLFHLMRVNERDQTIQATFSFRFSWTDQYVSWNTSEYNVDRIFLPRSKIWTPDIMILNAAMGELHDYLDTNVIVYPSGEVLWMVPYTPVTTCSINIRYYPFDVQCCDIQFISWTYAGKQLNLSMNSFNVAANYYSSDNQEWEVTKIDARRNDKIYACCPNDPYPDVTFTIHMRRHSLFYVINLIIPSVLIYGLAIVGFFLPSSQRVDMETTVWLTLIVFLSGVNETMPPTPDSVSVLSLYFLLILYLVALAIVAAVIVTNLAERPRFSPLPRWGSKLIRLVFKKHYHHPSIQSVLRVQRRRRQLAKVSQEEMAEINLGTMDFKPHVARAVSLATCRSYENADETAAIEPSDLYNLNEWKLFAEALDTLFFYFFLTLCLGMLLLFGALILPVVLSPVHDK